MALKGKKKSPEHRAKLLSNLKKHHFKKGYDERRKLTGSPGYHLSNETKMRLSISHEGAKSHLWQGGISSEPYSLDWTATLRRSIRERDRYTCRECGEPQGDVALDVHHIDYNKQNCSPNNLVTLCRGCHIRTNTNREKWKKHFKK